MNITIVGAGVVGCAIAYELAARGARVRIIDPRGVAAGATRASAGILAPYIEGQSPAFLRLCAASLALYDEFLRRVQADARVEIEYERRGTLQVALDPSQEASLEQLGRLLEETQVEHMPLDGRQARRAEPGLSDEVTAGLMIPAHGYVAPTALTEALSRAALRHGAILSHARVVAIEASPHGVDVVTPGVRVSDDAVIIAAGSWSSRLSTTAFDAVKPVRGQLLHLRTIERAATRVIWGRDCYLVPWRDGTVLAGATVEDAGYDESATADGVRMLLDGAIRLMPSLRDATFEQVRVGLRPKASDELPLIGPSSTMRNVYYATGHYRNGVLLAPVTAMLMADLLIERRERPELGFVRPSRMGL